MPDYHESLEFTSSDWEKSLWGPSTPPRTRPQEREFVLERCLEEYDNMPYPAGLWQRRWNELGVHPLSWSAKEAAFWLHAIVEGLQSPWTKDRIERGGHARLAEFQEELSTEDIMILAKKIREAGGSAATMYPLFSFSSMVYQTRER